MALINFDTARDMTIDCEKWMKSVSNYITDPKGPAPADIYGSQKLAFEIDRSELEELLKSEKVIGILGLEKDPKSLSVILVGVNSDGRPKEDLKPHEVWVGRQTMPELDDVLKTYLTP